MVTVNYHGGKTRKVASHPPPNTPIAKAAYDVSGVLRRDYKLHRRQAEWLCFRLMGVVEISFYQKSRNAFELASIFYSQWKQGGLEREYDIL